MNTNIASPRVLAAQRRKENEEQYRVDAKQFGVVLGDLVKVFHALTLLSKALETAGKGSRLAFPVQGGHVFFNRTNLRSANGKFVKAIKDLKNYLRVSKRKPRATAEPRSFAGIYAPIHAGPALVDFFSNEAGFGSVVPTLVANSLTGSVNISGTGGNLMTQLQLAKGGYLLRNTSTMLFYIYAHANGLQDPDNAQFVRSDAAMTRAFGGNIPAVHFSLPSQQQGGKPTKMLMQQAIDSGYVQSPGINTYQNIAMIHPPRQAVYSVKDQEKGRGIAGQAKFDSRGQPVPEGFDPSKFNTYFFQNIAAANYYSRAELTAQNGLAEQGAYLLQEDVRNAMLNEHNIVKDVSTRWHNLLEPSRKVKRDQRKKESDQRKKQQRGL
jgi:hypothetical protein